MKILTDEQLLFLQSLKTDEYKAIQKQAQEDLRLARIDYDLKLEAYRAKAAAEEARRAARLKILTDALRAAGIKLSVEPYGYDPVLWVKAELPDGTKVDGEFDEINTFDEESE